MAFEIFIEPELENLSEVENAAEWQEICNALGLEGQKTLSDKSPESKAPPYMFIDPKTERIIRTLCPKKTKIELFKDSTIPLDVLHEVKKCQENKWYHAIYIFSDDKTPDPFVVGFLTADYSTPMHLIARWGSELIPMELLEERAIQRIKENALKALNLAKASIEYAIKDPAAFLRGALSGEEMPKVNMSIDDLGYASNYPF